MINKELKEEIVGYQKKRTKLIKLFLEENMPDSLSLWAIYDLDDRIMHCLKEIHINLGGNSKTMLDR